MDIYEKTYRAALDWAKRYYPNASKYHVAAFGNSVVYLVTGASSSLGGGPSIREHLCSWSLMGPKGQWGKVQTDKGELTTLFPDGSMTPAGQWEFDVACGHAAAICFGELPPIAKVVAQQEFCFDDDPADMDALTEMD